MFIVYMSIVYMPIVYMSIVYVYDHIAIDFTIWQS